MISSAFGEIKPGVVLLPGKPREGRFKDETLPWHPTTGWIGAAVAELEEQGYDAGVATPEKPYLARYSAMRQAMAGRRADGDTVWGGYSHGAHGVAGEAIRRNLHLSRIVLVEPWEGDESKYPGSKSGIIVGQNLLKHCDFVNIVFVGTKLDADPVARETTGRLLDALPESHRVGHHDFADHGYETLLPDQTPVAPELVAILRGE